MKKKTSGKQPPTFPSVSFKFNRRLLLLWGCACYVFIEVIWRMWETNKCCTPSDRFHPDTFSPQRRVSFFFFGRVSVPRKFNGAQTGAGEGVITAENCLPMKIRFVPGKMCDEVVCGSFMRCVPEWMGGYEMELMRPSNVHVNGISGSTWRFFQWDVGGIQLNEIKLCTLSCFILDELMNYVDLRIFKLLDVFFLGVMARKS